MREVKGENHQAPSTSWEFCKMVYNDDSSEVETYAWMENEELHREVSLQL